MENKATEATITPQEARRRLTIAYLIEHGLERTDEVVAALQNLGADVSLYGFEAGDLDECDAVVSCSYFSDLVEVKVAGGTGRMLGLDNFESARAYAAALVAMVRRFKSLAEVTRRYEARQAGQPLWRGDDGRVDLDVVRAGTDSLDRESIIAALVAEVEGLRAGA